MKLKEYKLEPWEVVVFHWGTAIKHRKGKIETIYLNDGQEIDARDLNVFINGEGIFFN